MENAATSFNLRHSWGWILALGIGLTILGLYAISQSLLTTLISMLVVGWIMILGSILHTIEIFQVKKWNLIIVQVLAAVIYFVGGLLVLRNPGAAALSLTLIISAVLLIGGIFRIIAALTLQMPAWGWVLFNGIISLILGAMIMYQWPTSGLWIIGLFVGIDLLMHGLSLCAMSLEVRAGHTEARPSALFGQHLPQA